MPLILKSVQVGPWPMNAYVLIDADSQTAALVDPGADGESLLAAAEGAQITGILLTHAHMDHVGALAEVRARSGAPVYLHPLEGREFDVEYDLALADGQVIPIGSRSVRTVHTPGHTPGMISFVLDHRVIVGDTLFVGGSGRTGSPEDFAITMQTLQQTVFRWPDETEFYPGHGPSGTIGAERPAFEAFVARGWPPDLHGDVAW